MAACTVVYTSNVDGTGNDSIGPCGVLHKQRLTEVKDVAKGWVQQALGQGSS
jgi:hypothetical protein